mmetsp:Transcript_56295/g.117646  ORF Transcript_56295/g.117646 Transcript_56295/m.117646 type:complete len:399 (-) Transcript_56295:1456-2652(-)
MGDGGGQEGFSPGVDSFGGGGVLGGFLNATDALGNTALHMAAMHGRTAVVDWIMSKPDNLCGLETLNHEGLTPFTLAARHGNAAMYNHILYHYLSKIAWVYGKMRMRQTDLLQVDSYRIASVPLHANHRWRSSLEIVVAFEVHAFASDELLNKLILEKWERFGRSMYVRRIVAPYLALLVSFVAACCLRGDEIAVEWEVIQAASNMSEGPLPACTWPHDGFMRAIESDAGQPHFNWSPNKIATISMQGVLLLIWAPWLVYKGWWLDRFVFAEVNKNRDGPDGVANMMNMMDMLQNNIEFFLDHTAAATLVLSCVFRILCLDTHENNCTAAASVLLFFNLLHVLRPFRFFGGLMVTVHNMLRGDVPRFMVLYIVLHCGFAFSRYSDHTQVVYSINKSHT